MPKVVDHEERRKHLIRSVWRVIAENGLDGVTMRDVAREANSSLSAVAYYLGDKAELVFSAFRTSHQQMAERNQRAIRARSKHEALRNLLLANLPLDSERKLEALLEVNFWVRSLHSQAMSDAQYEDSETLRAQLLDLVAGSQGEGCIAPQRSADEVVGILSAAVYGISLEALLYPGRMDRRRQRSTIDFLLSLLSETPAAAG